MVKGFYGMIECSNIRESFFILFSQDARKNKWGKKNCFTSNTDSVTQVFKLQVAWGLQAHEDWLWHVVIITHQQAVQLHHTVLSLLPPIQKRGENMMTKKKPTVVDWDKDRDIAHTITFMGKTDLAHEDLYNLLPITNRPEQWELRNGAHSSGSVGSVLEQLVLALVWHGAALPLLTELPAAPLLPNPDT